MDSLIILKIEDNKFEKAFEFMDHRLEIISLSWSPDS